MSQTENRINNACLVILAAFAITAALIFTRSVSVPFVFSLFLFSVAAPAVLWFQQSWKLPRPLAVLVTALLFFISIAIVAYLIVLSLGGFIEGADVYVKRLVALIKGISTVSAEYGWPLDSSELLQELKSLKVLQVARDFTGGVIAVLGNIFLVSVFFLFLILGDRPVKANKIFDEIQKKISQYIVTKFFLSLVTGVLVGLILAFCGVELALMFAVLTVFLNFIPNIGSIVAVALPLPIIFLQFGFGWQFVVVFSLSVLVQVSVGNIIEPKMMGEGMDLHPVTVLVFLMFWGLIWGVSGMFLAVPITAVMKIIFHRIQTTRPLAELMAGRLPT